MEYYNYIKLKIKYYGKKEERFRGFCLKSPS